MDKKVCSSLANKNSQHWLSVAVYMKISKINHSRSCCKWKIIHLKPLCCWCYYYVWGFYYIWNTFTSICTALIWESVEVSLTTFIKSGQDLILLAKFVVILEDTLPLKAKINLLLWVVNEYESIPTVQSSVYEDAARYRSLSAIQLCTRYE